MKTKWLYVAIASLVVFLFAGNVLTVRSQSACPGEPGNCQCQVTLAKSGSAATQNPSCSVTFALSGHTKLKKCDIIEPGTFDRIVKCDTGIKAILRCRGSRHTVEAGTAMRLICDESGDYPQVKSTHEDSWVNNVGNTNTNASPESLRRILARVFGAESENWNGVITETERIAVLNGDAGIRMESGRPIVMVTAGEAIVESFCDGSVARLKAPAIVRLGNSVGNLDPYSGASMKIRPCTPESVAGRWYGAYDRIDKDGVAERIPVLIDLRGKPGTIETPDGVLDITESSFSDPSMRITAKARTGTGELELNGKFDKGGMSFQFKEKNLGREGSREGGGDVERLYIAQWAIPKAALDVPYRHSLLALSPAKGTLSWSVVDGKLPGGIALDGATGALSGTPASQGEHTFTVEVRDSNGDSFQQALSLIVDKMVLATPLLPAAILGQEYRFKLEMTGGSPPYFWTNAFVLPFPVPGMPPMPEISSTGEITYTPTQDAGLLMLTVSDSRGVTKRLTLGIETRGLTILGSEFLPVAVSGAPYSHTFTAAGQSGAAAWSESSAGLEGTGLALNPETGELSGTPAEAGIYTIEVSARDGKRDVARKFLLTIDPPPEAAAPAASSASCCSAARSRAANTVRR